MKRLLVRADDLGYTDGINAGIRRAVLSGIVRSVGVMANMPLAEEGIASLSGMDVAWGVHVNITAGSPLTGGRAQSLVNADGAFFPSASYRADPSRHVDCSEVFDEALAQIDRLAEMIGRSPDYVDYHAVADCTMMQAIENAAAARKLLCNPIPFGETEMMLRKTRVRCLQLRGSGQDDDATLFLKEQIESLKEGETGLYISHPGYVDYPLYQHDPCNIRRAQEVEALCDASLPEWLACRQVKLIDFRDL